MYSYFKRAFDLILAVIIGGILLIPMLIVALAIKIEDGGPVFFKQKRIGKGLKPFYIYKFRSMKTNRKELESNLTHEQMITKVGKFIRATSLDELPQIINVLKGEMSFIGPRPWIEDYYQWFTPEQKRRNEVLPGISGLAQAKGRNGLDILDKIKYDIEYVDNYSFVMDLKVLFLTIKTVLSEEEAEITEKGIKGELAELEELYIAREENNTAKVSA